MTGLARYAWRSLAARRARTILTVIGIAIGVSVLVAGLAVNAGLESAIARTVDSIIGRADLRVSAFAETGLSGAAATALDGVPGVALTAPAIERKSFLQTQPGAPSSGEPVSVLGIDPVREARVRDLNLLRGAQLSGLDEGAALITERLALVEGLDVGSQLTILGDGDPVTVRVAGILPGDGPALGSRGRTVVLPILTAARLNVPADVPPPQLDTMLGVSRVDVVLAAGASVDDVAKAIDAAVTTEPYVLSMPRDIAASMRASTADVRGTMALLASIGLFAAAFLIFNTLSMTVVERVRELGLLRAAGATRAQVTRIVTTQALVLGIAGSLLGVGLGWLLAQLIASWMRGSGDLNLQAPELTLPLAAAAVASGLLITLVASLEPARRAGSVSPVTALRARSDAAATVRSHVRWLVVVMALVAGLVVLLLPVGEGGSWGPARALAVYAILLLAVLVTPVLIAPLARVIGLPFSLLGRLEERLARAALGRDRGRTTLTVGALVVGVAMVVGMGCVQVNARAATSSWLTDVVPGDEILTAIAPAPTGEDGVDTELKAIPGVTLATALASFDLAYQGTRLDATAIHGADFAADGRLTFVAGSRDEALAAIDAGGAVILPTARAQRLGLGLGDTMTVTAIDGQHDLKVVGIVDRSFPGRTGETALVGWSDAQQLFGVEGADSFAVRYDPAQRTVAEAAVRDLAAAFALTVAPVTAVVGAAVDALDRVFGLLDVLALAAVVIAALGIVNTLAMDTWERIPELGMLRAAGMSRRQVWRSVVVEAGILGTIGALVGSVSGLAIGILLVVTWGGRLDRSLQLPWPTIVAALVVGVVLAMLAAAQPARAAGRRTIVSAVYSD